MSCLRVLFVWDGVGCFGDGEGVKMVYYLLPPWQKEVMFLVALVCLFACLFFVCMFVCLFVDNITQKVMNGLG